MISPGSKVVDNMVVWYVEFSRKSKYEWTLKRQDLKFKTIKSHGKIFWENCSYLSLKSIWKHGNFENAKVLIRTISKEVIVEKPKERAISERIVEKISKFTMKFSDRYYKISKNKESRTLKFFKLSDLAWDVPSIYIYIYTRVTCPLSWAWIKFKWWIFFND